MKQLKIITFSENEIRRVLNFCSGRACTMPAMGLKEGPLSFSAEVSNAKSSQESP